MLTNNKIINDYYVDKVRDAEHFDKQDVDQNTDQNTTSPIVISNRNHQVMQFLQISQPARLIAASSNNVNNVKTRSAVKIKSEKLGNITNESNPTTQAPTQKQKSNKGVKKGTIRDPYKKKSQ